MTALEQSIAAICKQHDVSSLSINFDIKHKWTAYVHWWIEDECFCASGCGETETEALTKAITESHAKRNDIVITLADAALPSIAA